jgi:hypothetical protein
MCERETMNFAFEIDSGWIQKISISSFSSLSGVESCNSVHLGRFAGCLQFLGCLYIPCDSNPCILSLRAMSLIRTWSLGFNHLCVFIDRAPL